LATGFGFAGLLPLTSKDRPLGLTLQLSGFVLRRRAIVVTREILEAALTPAPASTGESQADELRRMMLARNQMYGLGGSLATTPDASLAEHVRASQEDNKLLEQPIRARPGENTIAVPLVDGPTLNLRGNYILYLRVERVP
jgi:hypothetical protein